MIIAEGGGSGGFTLFVKDGKLVYESNFFAGSRYTLTSPDRLPSGKVTVAMDYVQGAKDNAGGGRASLSVNGAKVAEGNIDRVVPARFSATETLDIGMDLGSTVSRAYHDKAPFPFTGGIQRVVVELGPN